MGHPPHMYSVRQNTVHGANFTHPGNSATDVRVILDRHVGEPPSTVRLQCLLQRVKMAVGLFSKLDRFAN